MDCTTIDNYHHTSCVVPSPASILIHAWDEVVGSSTSYFDHWEGCGGMNGSKEAALMFSPSSDITCTAVFIKKVIVNLATNGIGGGTVTGHMADCTTNDNYHHMTCVVIPPASILIHSWNDLVGTTNYYFDHWEGCGSMNGSKEAALTFSPTSDITCTAIFRL
ncbi:MAG: hypothetical protein JWN48_1731 [Myxococcaceae bacterium]|nr:hypothetical protein [Myxococcaceae bacterium]